MPFIVVYPDYNAQYSLLKHHLTEIDVVASGRGALYTIFHLEINIHRMYCPIIYMYIIDTCMINNLRALT